MRYLSVCSGIEAATVAWHGLGWTPVGFSEIEAFPSQVLKHHYPDVQNFGDLTKHATWPLELESTELLVGGTPCQSFSVAGLRKGLSDPRGNLALVYLGLLDRLRPRWCVWENVPGVLSSAAGRDFGAFLGALGQLGYGWAYRVLDAQYFGVAQRRRRVFVVGYLGDWRRAAAVLFEPESVRRDPAPRREAGQGAARRARPGAARGGGGVTTSSASHWDDPRAPHPTLNRSCFTGYSNQEIFSQRGAGLVPAESLAFNSYARTIAPVTDPIMADGHANREQGVLVPSEPLGFDTYNQRVTGHVAHPLRNTNGTFGDALPAVLVPAEHSPAKPAVLPFDPRQIAHPANFSRPTFGAPSHPLRAVANAEPAVVIQRAPEMHVAFKPSHYTRGKDGAPSEVAPPLSADADKGDQDPVVLTVAFQSNQGTRGGNVFEEVSPTVRVDSCWPIPRRRTLRTPSTSRAA